MRTELREKAVDPFFRGARAWFGIVLAWQCVGLVGTLALSLPWGDFHYFVEWTITGLTFTNLVAVLAGGSAAFCWNRLRDRGIVVQVTAIVLSAALGISLSLWAALAVGRRVCGLDSFVVDRWHLLMITIDAALMAAIALVCALVFVYRRLSADLERSISDNARL